MRKYPDLFLVSIVAFSAYQLYYVWLVWKGFSYLNSAVYSLETRPFVYRVLIPFLSRVLEGLTGFHAVYCMIFLLVLSSIGLFYSLKYLYQAFIENQNDAGLFAFAGCELTFLLILIGVKPYDIATAMFFAISLGLLARGKFNLYYLIFVVASINRETTFLLTLFFMIYFFNRIPFKQYCFGILYQGLAYLIVKVMIMSIYTNVPGTLLQWRPLEVIKGYFDKPVWFAVFFLIFFLALIMLSVHQWSEKPIFLRTAFGTMFPALLILHIFLGYSYEIRVFAEVFPVIFVLCALSMQRLRRPAHLQETQVIS